MTTPSASRAAPIEAILFDLFHTLVDMSRAPARTSTPEILGIDPLVWSRKVIEDSPHHALGTETDPVESIRRIAHAIDPSISTARIVEAARQRPARFRSALVDVRPEVLEMLRRLRAWGLKIGLISNAGLDEVGGWDESPLAPLFDTALFSCHEGVMKPDPEIYLRAARRLDVPSARCLFAGDGGSREHEGAIAAGMRTVLMLPILEALYPTVAEARPRITDWTVDSFEGFLELVARLRREGLPSRTSAVDGGGTGDA